MLIKKKGQPKSRWTTSLAAAEVQFLIGVKPHTPGRILNFWKGGDAAAVWEASAQEYKKRPRWRLFQEVKDKGQETELRLGWSLVFQLRGSRQVVCMNPLTLFFCCLGLRNVCVCVCVWKHIVQTNNLSCFANIPYVLLIFGQKSFRSDDDDDARLPSPSCSM